MASSSRQKANGVAFPAEIPSKRSSLNTQMASSSRPKGRGVAFPVETPRKRPSLNTQMASTSRQKGKSVTLPVETPGFFKVVLDYALQGGRLVSTNLCFILLFIFFQLVKFKPFASFIIFFQLKFETFSCWFSIVFLWFFCLLSTQKLLSKKKTPKNYVVAF